jgi:hypothetical protein
MRKTGLVLILSGLCLILAGIFVQSQSQPFEIIEIATGADPHWSLDGTKLAYVYKGTLYIKNADGTGEAKKISELPNWTDGFDWLDSTEFVFWGKEYKRIGGEGRQYTETRIKTLTMDGKEKLVAETVDGPEEVRTSTRISIPMVLPDRTVGYYESPYEDVFLEKSEWKAFKIIKQGKLPPDSAMKQMRAIAIPAPGSKLLSGDIWLESLDGDIRKKITTGKLYSFPKLSPDGKKILAVCGSNGWCILDLQNNETHIGKKTIKSGEISEWSMGPPAMKWSPDGNKVVYAYVKTKVISEHDFITLGSEIYIENAEGGRRTQITNTPDEVEIDPVWSADGTRIACRGSKTSKIYVIKLK